MKTHSLIQGSKEWHQHRLSHFNASDAPAMMGVSPYKTRSKLLEETATGLVDAEFDEATQRRFADGHRFERLARPLAEEIAGQDLYPATGSEGKHSASFDGITMCESVIFEHKTLSDRIRAAKSASELPKDLRIQMEHQLHVSGAEKCLFMASVWDEGDELVEEIHYWYMPDLDSRSCILDGWSQFEKDLAAYVPREIAEKPQAESVIALPALLITAKGEVTSTNMPSFKDAARTFLAKINRTLETDQQFADAKESAKVLRETAVKLKAKKEEMLEQTASIGEVAREIDLIVETFNKTALALEKDVKEKEISIKVDIANAAKVAYAAHVAALEAEISPIRLVLPVPDFAGTMKNQRTIASLHDKVDGALANGKIEADSVAKDIRAKLAWCKDNADGMSFLFPDLQQIIVKPMDDFTLLITIRIKDHKDAEALKAAEIIAKADAAAAAKLESERAAMQADEERKSCEKVAAEQAAERANVEAEAKAQKALDDLEEETLRKQEAAESKKTPAEEPRPDQVVVGVDLDNSGADQAVRNMSSGKRVQPVPIIIDRPTDAEIIGALAVRFAVSEQTVKSWLADMNLEAAA